MSNVQAVRSFKDLIPEQPPLMKAIRESSGDLNGIAKVISSNKDVQDEVLETVNAPYFGLVREIQSTEEAVRFLGEDRIVNITNSRLLPTSFSNEVTPENKNFWKHANNMAVTTAIFGKQLKIASADESYTLGLFHNGGMAVLDQQVEGYFEIIEKSYHAENGLVTSYENEVLQTHHAIIGAEIARKWLLPPSITEVIEKHHDIPMIQEMLSRASNETSNLMAVLKISEHFSRLHGYLGRCKDDYEWRVLETTVLEYLGLSMLQLERLENRVRQILLERKSKH